MSKRVALTQRRTGDKDGLDALFEPTLPASAADTGAPEAAEPAAPKLTKATYYIRPEQVIALEALQLRERQRLGRRRDKSELIQEALDLLFAHYE